MFRLIRKLLAAVTGERDRSNSHGEHCVGGRLRYAITVGASGNEQPHRVIDGPAVDESGSEYRIRREDAGQRPRCPSAGSEAIAGRAYNRIAGRRSSQSAERKRPNHGIVAGVLERKRSRTANIGAEVQCEQIRTGCSADRGITVVCGRTNPATAAEVADPGRRDRGLNDRRIAVNYPRRGGTRADGDRGTESR